MAQAFDDPLPLPSPLPLPLPVLPASGCSCCMSSPPAGSDAGQPVTRMESKPANPRRTIEDLRIVTGDYARRWPPRVTRLSLPLALQDEADDATRAVIAGARFGPNIESVVDTEHREIVVVDARREARFDERVVADGHALVDRVAVVLHARGQ